MVTTEGENIFRIPGLEEAYRERRDNFDGFVSQIPVGGKIEFRLMTLALVLPTDPERILLERSIKEERELGLVIVADRSEIVTGDKYEIDPSKVIETLQSLGHIKGQPWSHTHTHWHKTSGRSPFPSTPDRIQRGIFNINQPVCEYRIAFSLYDEPMIFVVLEDRG